MENAVDGSAWVETGTGEKVPVGEKCIMGRAKDCQVVLNTNQTSRRHAMIYQQGKSEFWLADLGSANGTRHNGRHISQHRRLSDGDRIEVGGSVLIFRQPGVSAGKREEVTAIVSTSYEIRSFPCWLLVADMVGSTIIVRQLSADEAAKLTGGLLAQWKQIVEQHRGIVNKYLGDGFLAYWPDGEKVAPEIVEVLKEFKQLEEQAEAPFRLVLHHGLAISGGAPSLGEESLTGKDVNFAFRMEDLASSLGTRMLLSAAAVKQLGPLPDFQSQGGHSLAGFDGLFEFFSF